MSDIYYVHDDNYSRYAEPEELENDYMEVSFDTSSDNGTANIAAGLGIEARRDENGKITGALVDGRDTNTLLVSAPGTGKTRRVLSLYLLSVIMARQSFLTPDPKGENIKKYYSLLKEKGYLIKVINLREPMRGDRFNILQEAARQWKTGNTGEALQMANSIAQMLFSAIEDANDKVWSISSINLFMCYFCIAATIYEPENVTLGSLYRIHLDGSETVNGVCGTLRYLNAHKGEKCYDFGIDILNAASDTKRSVFFCFASALSRILMNEEIEDLLCCSTFNAEELALSDKPVALFIITRDEATKTYAGIVSSIVDQIYTSVIGLAYQQPNGMLPRTVHFILEEFGNMSKLENINDMLSASRSRGIRIMIVLQSLCQLELNYSKKEAENLIGNTQNLVYLYSTDMELVEMISKRCGTYKDTITGEVRPFLSPDRLTHLNVLEGDCLMLLGQHYPYRTVLPDISEYEMVKPVDEAPLPVREKLQQKRGFMEMCKKAYEESLRKQNAKEREDKAEDTKVLTAFTGDPKLPSLLSKEFDKLLME